MIRRPPKSPSGKGAENAEKQLQTGEEMDRFKGGWLKSYSASQRRHGSAKSKLESTETQEALKGRQKSGSKSWPQNSRYP